MQTEQSTSIEDLIKGLIFEVALKALIARIISYLPFLALPIINPIFVWLISKVALMAYEELAKFVNFQVIDLEIEGNRRRYDDATERLRKQHDKPPEERNELEVEDAKNQFRDTLRDLIRFKLR